MLKPIAAIDNPSMMASGKACHHVAATKTSMKYNPAKTASMIAVFKYIWGQSR
jgi:hypothetical protein